MAWDVDVTKQSPQTLASVLSNECLVLHVSQVVVERKRCIKAED